MDPDEEQVEGHAGDVVSNLPRLRTPASARVGEAEPSELSIMAPFPNSSSRGGVRVDPEEEILSTLRARQEEDKKAEQERLRNSAFSTLVQNYNRPDAPNASGSPVTPVSPARGRGQSDNSTLTGRDDSDSKSATSSDHPRNITRAGLKKPDSYTQLHAGPQASPNRDKSVPSFAAPLMRSQSTRSVAGPSAGASAASGPGARGSLGRMDSWSRLAVPKTKQALNSASNDVRPGKSPAGAAGQPRGRRGTMQSDVDSKSHVSVIALPIHVFWDFDCGV